MYVYIYIYRERDEVPERGREATHRARRRPVAEKPEGLDTIYIYIYIYIVTT